MKNQLATLAFVTLAALSAGAHAADTKPVSKPVSIESWSFGCSNPSMATQTGSSPEARASYDLKAAKGARVAASPPACATNPDGATAPQAVRESPSKASLGRGKEYVGHVTLMK